MPLRLLNFFSISILMFTTLGCSINKKINNSKSTINNSYRPINVKIYEQIYENTLGPCEPSIYINPSDPKNMVAGSVLDYVHTSFNGGQTWNTKKITSKYGIWGDPTVIADTKGTFYYFHLSDPEGTNWKSDQILDRIVVQKSTDQGKTWSTGTGIGLNAPKQQDKQWALINPKYNNLLYTAWTEFDAYNSSDEKDRSRILFSKSTNGSTTWTTPVPIGNQEGNCLDDDLTPEGTTLASDGKNLYVAWAYDSKIWFSQSSNQGNTWSKEIAIAYQPNGWSFEIKNMTRCNGFPVMDIDLSNSKNKGTLYLNWSSQVNDKQTDVFFSKSIDKGKTWSTPKTVYAENKPAHHFFNWMNIDPKTGNLYVIYYKETQVDSSLIEVHLGVSKNGGDSFNDYIISEKPFNPKGANFFGDYNNISAYNGIIRPIWTQVTNGLVSVWTALINEKDLK